MHSRNQQATMLMGALGLGLAVVALVALYTPAMAGGKDFGDGKTGTYDLSLVKGAVPPGTVEVGTADHLCLHFSLTRTDGSDPGRLTALTVHNDGNLDDGDWTHVKLWHDSQLGGPQLVQTLTPTDFSDFPVTFSGLNETIPNRNEGSLFTGVFRVTVSVADGAAAGNTIQLRIVFSPGEIVLDPTYLGSFPPPDFTGGEQEIVDGGGSGPGEVEELFIDTQPGDAFGGTPFGTQPVIHLLDDQDELVDDDDTTEVSVAIESGPDGGVLSGTTTVTASGGIVEFTNLSIDLIGDYTLVFSTTGGLDVTSETFTVAIGDAAELRMVVDPGNATAGAVFGTQPQVEIVDAGGNRLTNDNATEISVSIKDGTGNPAASLAGGGPLAVSAGLATWTGLAIDLAGEGYVLEFGAESLALEVESDTFNVAAVATQIGFGEQPGGAVIYEPFSEQPIIEAQDANGDIVTTHGGTNVTVTKLSGPGDLGGTDFTVEFENGEAVFSGLYFDLPGEYVLRFTSDGGLGTVDSVEFTVASVPYQLHLSTPPAGARAGLAFSVQPVVAIHDQNDALVENADNTVSVAITGGGTAGAVLSGTTNVDAVDGVATFSGLSIDLVGQAYELTFTANEGANPLLAATATLNVTLSSGSGSAGGGGCALRLGSGQAGLPAGAGLLALLALAGIAGLGLRRRTRA